MLWVRGGVTKGLGAVQEWTKFSWDEGGFADSRFETSTDFGFYTGQAVAGGCGRI